VLDVVLAIMPFGEPIRAILFGLTLSLVLVMGVLAILLPVVDNTPLLKLGRATLFGRGDTES
jgi:hypothetical protein